MIFNEIYSAYYKTVAMILKEATKEPLLKAGIREIIEENAFEESIISIPDAIDQGRWQLIKEDGTTPVKVPPKLPLTMVEKQWLKAISLDPRIKLFGDMDFGFLDDIEALFKPSDVLVFDQYNDGDDFSSETYIANFRLILDAIKKSQPLTIEMTNGSGKKLSLDVMPKKLEYSEKDSKFRLIGVNEFYNTINLGRIEKCSICNNDFDHNMEFGVAPEYDSVTFELINERNSLERVLLHFAHLDKRAEKLDDDKYLVTINYTKDDETEVLIRILSFGPMIKVVSPASFVNLIRQRLIEQESCE